MSTGKGKRLNINHLDHLVLTVQDIKRTIAFYTRVLNMQEITFGNNRKGLLFGVQKINLHALGKEFEPKATQPTPGSADLCFIAATPMQEIIAHLAQENITIVEGPVRRLGANGPLQSVYFYDPDGNLIEVSNYV